MRLIDADALNYSTHRECAGHGEYYEIEIITKSKIDNAPTIDICNGQKMMDRITALPSVEAEWIPCSERLPKPDEEVFVYLWGDVPQLASVNGEGQWETDNFYLDADDSPKAWMPLPKPYREDGEK